MPARLRLHAAPATLVSFAVILALAVVALVASSGAAVAAKKPKCGDTITTDTTLHKDLVDCPNNGIIIGADNVTLDLNGHLVDGDGTEFAGCDPNAAICDSGVVNDGHDGVTVMHGRVREFGVGVLLGTTTPGRVRHNRLLDISSSKNLFFGFVVASTARSVVRESSGSNNIAPEGDGMGLFDAHHVRVLHNSFRHNPGPNIHVGDSSDNVIKENLIARNRGIAVLLEEADRNRVRGNRFVRNGSSVVVAPGGRNVIARNRVLRGESGIGIEKGRGNLVARNVLVRPRRTGIYLALQHPPIGGAHNLIRRNVVRGSGGDGFLVRQEDHRSLLKRNVAKGAEDDGFDVRSRSTKVTRNRALRNHDLGIEAVRGVNDGGGNIARHNGDPRQCTHIVCR
jgi:parallel beta-helix repeat protein